MYMYINILLFLHACAHVNNPKETVTAVILEYSCEHITDTVKKWLINTQHVQVSMETVGILVARMAFLLACTPFIEPSPLATMAISQSREDRECTGDS